MDTTTLALVLNITKPMREFALSCCAVWPSAVRNNVHLLLLFIFCEELSTKRTFGFVQLFACDVCANAASGAKTPTSNARDHNQVKTFRPCMT
tara:strand:- start:2141 stop:2419 length:279 start_codon:yes stop_codon:yes gene_type:complete